MLNEATKQFFAPILIAIALILTTPTAFAAEMAHKFRVRIVCADDINCSRGVRLFYRAAAYIKEAVGVEFRVVKVERTNIVIASGDYEERLNEWADKLGRKEDLTFVLVDGYPKGRYLDFPNEEILGIVESIGGLGQRPVIGLAKMVGSDDFAVKVMIHEVGHLLGATHIHLGIMAPSAQENQYTEAYAIETIAQIKEYLATLQPQ